MRALRAADPALGRLIDRIGPFRLTLDATSSVFLALAEAIVYQQLTGRAAATIFARLQALFPHAAESPTPEQLLRASDARLLSAGLSRAKLLALTDLARRTVAGELPTLEQLHGLDDEPIIEQLTRVRGIGRWTAEMLLIFRLGRPDVLPLDDYGVPEGPGADARPARAAHPGAARAPWRTLGPPPHRRQLVPLAGGQPGVTSADHRGASRGADGGRLPLRRRARRAPVQEVHADPRAFLRAERAVSATRSPAARTSWSAARSWWASPDSRTPAPIPMRHGTSAWPSS